MISKENRDKWQLASTDVFWGEIAPCNHVLQIYEDNDAFLEMLAGFAGSGIKANESVVIIATSSHITALNDRLKAHGIHIEHLIENDQYIALDAQQTLAKFMVDGWPDETLFMNLVSRLIKRARRNNRKVRAFGEMVAILWAEGRNGATVQLEHLWNKFCAEEDLCLFCAYPKIGFTSDPDNSLIHICNSHSKIIEGSDRPLMEVFYKAISPKVTALKDPV